MTLHCLLYKLCFLQVVAHTLLLPEQESLYSSQTVTVLLLFFSFAVIGSSLHHHSPSCFSPLCPCHTAPLVGWFFFGSLSLLPLSVLISRRSPAHSILFALGQDKHCLCVTPKTFHRLSRFQHGPDISIIGFFLLWECLRESENGKEKKGGGKRVSNRRRPKKGQFPFPPGPY